MSAFAGERTNHAPPLQIGSYSYPRAFTPPACTCVSPAASALEVMARWNLRHFVLRSAGTVQALHPLHTRRSVARPRGQLPNCDMGADRLGHVLEASMKTGVSQARAAISSPNTSRHVVRGCRAAHDRMSPT
jgi:hypothetical protein